MFKEALPALIIILLFSVLYIFYLRYKIYKEYLNKSLNIDKYILANFGYRESGVGMDVHFVHQVYSDTYQVKIPIGFSVIKSSMHVYSTELRGKIYCVSKGVVKHRRRKFKWDLVAGELRDFVFGNFEDYIVIAPHMLVCTLSEPKINLR